MPAAAWIYVLLRAEVAGRVVRLALSAGGSYAVTTLIFFAAAVLNVSWIFYAFQFIVAAGLIWYFVKNSLLQFCFRSSMRFDWLLAALIAASMAVNRIPRPG